MEHTSESVTHLDDQQCWDRLAEQQLGRLVTHAGAVLDIFPVNYTVDGRSIVFRTAEGSKLTELTIDENGRVTAARVIDSLGHGLDEAALAAVREASFSPATRCGRPVAATVKIGLTFTLGA